MLFNHRILMCYPEFFDVVYSINPWMDPKGPNKVSNATARQQWVNLHHLVCRLGGYVDLVPPQSDLPDMCFTANAGLYYQDKVVLSRFKHKERQKETVYFQRMFTELGYEVFAPSKDFEGAGDAFIMNDILFLGTGFRSDSKVASQIVEYLNLKDVIICKLTNPYFYHLDTCFCPISDREFIFYPGAFDSETIEKFDRSGFVGLRIDEEEAKRFSCNAVILGEEYKKQSAIVPRNCMKTMSILHYHGLKPYAVDLSQFLLSGGSAKCLTLKLGHSPFNPTDF